MDEKTISQESKAIVAAFGTKIRKLAQDNVSELKCAGTVTITNWLAKRTSITAVSLWYILEGDVKPDLRQALEIAGALGLSLGDIIREIAGELGYEGY